MAYDPTPIRRDSVITQAAQEICRLIEAERLGPGEDVLPLLGQHATSLLLIEEDDCSAREALTLRR